MPRRLLSFSLFLLACACAGDGPDDRRHDESADALWATGDTLTEAELEAGRLDDSWREAVRLGRPPARRELPLDTIVIPPAWRIPDPPPAERAEVLRIQTLLDRAGFYPGVLDGRWGKNTEKAIHGTVRIASWLPMLRMTETMLRSPL